MSSVGVWRISSVVGRRLAFEPAAFFDFDAATGLFFGELFFGAGSAGGGLGVPRALPAAALPLATGFFDAAFELGLALSWICTLACTLAVLLDAAPCCLLRALEVGDFLWVMVSGGISILDQGVRVDVAEALPAAQEDGLEDERARRDVPADSADELERRVHRAAGREQVVDQEHALPARDRIDVDLDRVGAVLELVALRRGLPRQLARLADRNEALAHVHRERGAEDESARLDAADEVVGLRIDD